jgi:type III secretion protein V
MRTQQALSPTPLERLAQRGDALIIVLVVAIVALMILPIPLAILDMLIALNIALSIGLMMLAIYVPSGVGISTFPSLLLFTTCLRLSLNIASTKSILLHAHAGHIIETFGRLVVGGNALVGAVVFIIIAIVQFIVIAKGSERVAEVGARFTLDAMPGKQMSIDADLRAGIIDKEDARRRRQSLESESQWHGAMDGAMKFVKGDAIAGLIVAFVNILAGIAVGAGMKGMSISDAVSRYTLLTVGDGMVSQIPSLFVSVAAGVLITRVSSSDGERAHLGAQVMSQVLAHPTAVIATASIMFVFLIVPGFPPMQFILLGAVLGVIGYYGLRAKRNQDPDRQRVPEMAADAERGAPLFVDYEHSRMALPLLVQLAPGLRHALNPEAFASAIESVRSRLYEVLGLPFPGVRLRYDERLSADNYRILVQDVAMAGGSLVRGHRRISASHPQFALAAPTSSARQADALPELGAGVWVQEEQCATISENPRPLAPEEVLAHHLLVVVFSRADSFIGIQETQRLIEEASAIMPELTQELTRVVPVQRLADIMRRLVQEGVSLRNTRELFESLISWAPREKDNAVLLELVRIDLGLFTVNRFAAGRQELPIIMLSSETEKSIRGAIQANMNGPLLALAPPAMEQLMRQLRLLIERARAQKIEPVLVCAMDVRRVLGKALEPSFGRLAVFSYQELSSHIRLTTVGILSMS